MILERYTFLKFCTEFLLQLGKLLFICTDLHPIQKAYPTAALVYNY